MTDFRQSFVIDPEDYQTVLEVLRLAPVPGRTVVGQQGPRGDERDSPAATAHEVDEPLGCVLPLAHGGERTHFAHSSWRLGEALMSRAVRVVDLGSGGFAVEGPVTAQALAIRSAASITAVDVVFVARRRISPI